MRFAYIIYGLIALTAACSSKTSETSGDDELTKDSSVQLKAESPVVSDKPKTLEEVNKLLFDNLVNGEFGPYAVKNDSGYYVLGVESYKERLRKLEIFSDEFYKHEEDRVAKCKKDLEALKYKGADELGWAPNSCFFDYMYWLRSQEHPTGYEIKNLEIAESYSKATMVFYDEIEKEKSYWNDNVYLDIYYRKEGNEWRVTEVLRQPGN